jgi:hypothetical protein
MKWCKVCGVSALSPLWKDTGGNQWHRCGACGSDSSEATYPPDHYTDDYLVKSLERTGGIEAAKEYVRSNIEWFDHHKDKCGGLDFLDVGCLEGAAMMVAAEHGWRVHGFDVIEAARQPGCSTIHPYFAASLFPQVYHAVMCREVLEHVEGWRGFIRIDRRYRPQRNITVADPPADGHELGDLLSARPPVHRLTVRARTRRARPRIYHPGFSTVGRHGRGARRPGVAFAPDR